MNLRVFAAFLAVPCIAAVVFGVSLLTSIDRQTELSEHVHDAEFALIDARVTRLIGRLEAAEREAELAIKWVRGLDQVAQALTAPKSEAPHQSDSTRGTRQGQGGRGDRGGPPPSGQIHLNCGPNSGPLCGLNMP